jgi:signal transduction histidine kinase
VVELQLAGARGLPSQPASLLFRAAQEILRNVDRHAQAGRVAISVFRDGPVGRLEITDDGRGFDPAVLTERRQQGHLGLLAIRDLVDNAGGRLRVRSAPGQGTTVVVEVPVP